MNYNKIFIVLMLVSIGLQINAAEEIQEEVDTILNWAKSHTKEELGILKNTDDHLNTHPSKSSEWFTNPIEIKAKKIAKDKIFSNTDYLTNEEQIQQGWPIDIGVPRNMTPQEKQQLQNKITQVTNSWAQRIVDHCKDIINNRKKFGLPPLTMQEITKDFYSIIILENNDDTLANQSKKIAYKKILSLLSYWEQYAPNFVKNIGYKLRATKNYISSWTIDPIINRLYQTLKQQKKEIDIQRAFGLR